MNSVVSGKHLIFRVFLLFFFSASFKSIRAQQHVYDFNVDSFRQVIIDGFTLNSPILDKDTFLFLRQGLYAFVNFDQTSTFQDVLMCYERGYNHLPDPDQRKFDLAPLRMSRDIRVLFLFYLERYFLGFRSSSYPLHKLSTFKMIDMDSQDDLPVFGEKGSECIIGLYRKLIVSIDKPEFKRLVIQEKKYGLLN